MAKYAFPAVFTKDPEGYSINFPDIQNCFTSGMSIPEGIEMANDVLCLTLYDKEEKGEPIPAPSDIHQISCAENEFVTMIACDTVEYRKYFDNKAVKKTLTIPNWLNTLAEKEAVNFSQILQAALKQHLGIE